MACPNKSLESYQVLVKEFGEGKALAVWEITGENIPTVEEGRVLLESPTVNTQLRSVEVAQTPKAQQEWNKFKKGNTTFQQFLDNSQFPKEQKPLLQDIYNEEKPQTLQDLITSLVAKYSYTVEINTAKEQKAFSRMYNTGETIVERSGKYFYYDPSEDSYSETTKVEYDKWQKESNDETLQPTQHYSNLTVPGGINYTENEIATPNITPFIKGHAQFSTDNGLGWFRSDEEMSPNDKNNRRVNKELSVDDAIDGDIDAIEDYLSGSKGEGSKIRRILEVQSDYGQKQRKSSEPDIHIKYDIDNIIDRLKKSGELKVIC